MSNINVLNYKQKQRQGDLIEGLGAFSRHYDNLVSSANNRANSAENRAESAENRAESAERRAEGAERRAENVESKSKKNDKGNNHSNSKSSGAALVVLLVAGLGLFTLVRDLVINKPNK